jgi:N-methylhydantoinase B
VWREVQYIDHDGHAPVIYQVVCDMTKRGDRLRFDFTETDQQATGFINCTFSGLRAAVLSATYILLGWDLPWNQGIAKCIDIVCPEGKLVNAAYPAPTSMATISTIIVVINTVFRPLSQLLSLTESYRDEAMGVWTGTSLAPVVSGISQSGYPFVYTEMSHFAGGSGARTYKDGMDTGGIVFNTTPSIANIETAEQDYPVLYLFRRQLCDSGGPGRYRGGVSGELAYIVHDAPGGVLEVSFAGGGAEQPNGVGLAGGLPGATVRVIRVHAGALETSLREGLPLPSTLEETGGRLEVMAQKHGRTAFPPGDVWYHNWQGGGGYGDPLERDPAAVQHDVSSGLVSRTCASEIYGVVLSERGVDLAATSQRRQALREERVSGEITPATAADSSPAALRYGDYVELASNEDHMRCARCRRMLGASGDDLRQVARRVVRSLSAAGPIRGEGYDRGRFQLHTYCCPGCGVQFEVDVQLIDGGRPGFRVISPGS